MSAPKRLNAGITHDHGHPILEETTPALPKNLGEITLGVVYQGDKIQTKVGLYRMLLDAICAALRGAGEDPAQEVERIEAAYKAHQARLVKMEADAKKITQIGRGRLVDARGVALELDTDTENKETS